ncbi:MAG: radical SAM protein [Chloroflexi bacterium RBG_13_48_10]|nr:MAG: radical SAM protein [Chloroflexi bacterium RBG_13_48_10]
MKVHATTGNEDIAMVYVVETSPGNLVECVESVQPPLPREKKWVLLVSTMFGCPIGCLMCDAGGYYHGKPTKDEILAQIDFLVDKRFPTRNIPCEQFKIQFARMGEPSLNMQVLNVLEELPSRYHAPGLMPSISTIAPAGTERFFNRLLQIKQEKYKHGHFQFQISLHTTDSDLRDRFIPVKKWSFAQIGEYGERFYTAGDRKVTLNFALAQGMPVDPAILLNFFDPDIFLIKITPLNPTYRARENDLVSYVDPLSAVEKYEIIQALQEAGYQVILSIGETEENLIGSNCGQFLRRHLLAEAPIADGYTYQVNENP